MNEPHKIVRVSVDIAEKYKDYSLERSYVEKRKETKKKSHLVGKEHQRGEHHNSTLSVGLGQQHRESTSQLSFGWIRASTQINTQCGAMEGAFCHDESTN